MTTSERQEWLCTFCKAVSPIRSKRSLDISGDSISSENEHKLRKLDDRSALLEDIAMLLDKKLEPITKLFTEKIEALTQEVSKLKLENAELRQYSRKNSTLIQGLPRTEPRENPIDLAIRFAKEVGFKLDKCDIDDAHRLPSKSDKKPFLIKFISRVTKREFIIHCKQKRDLNVSILGGSPNTRIYVNDHLTPETSKLFQTARLRLKPLGYVVTTRNCIVTAKDPDINRFATIRSEEDIEELALRKASGSSYSLNSSQRRNTTPSTRETDSATARS